MCFTQKLSLSSDKQVMELHLPPGAEWYFQSDLLCYLATLCFNMGTIFLQPLYNVAVPSCHLKGRSLI